MRKPLDKTTLIRSCILKHIRENDIFVLNDYSIDALRDLNDDPISTISEAVNLLVDDELCEKHILKLNETDTMFYKVLARNGLPVDMIRELLTEYEL